MPLASAPSESPTSRSYSRHSLRSLATPTSRFTSAWSLAQLLRTVHSRALALASPALAENRVRKLLAPPSTFYIISVLDEFSMEGKGPLLGILINFTLFVALGLFALPLVLQVYMFSELFSDFGVSDPVVWASLGLSAGLIIASVAALIASDRLGPDTPITM